MKLGCNIHLQMLIKEPFSRCGPQATRGCESSSGGQKTDLGKQSFVCVYLVTDVEFLNFDLWPGLLIRNLSNRVVVEFYVYGVEISLSPESSIDIIFTDPRLSQARWREGRVYGGSGRSPSQWQEPETDGRPASTFRKQAAVRDDTPLTLHSRGPQPLEWCHPC